jgi:hypothetical protein
MFRASSCSSSEAYKLQEPPLVYRWNVVVTVSLVVVGPVVTATAVYKILMMGKKMPETCCAVFERRAINLRD